jgi:hypothetical protein
MSVFRIACWTSVPVSQAWNFQPDTAHHWKNMEVNSISENIQRRNKLLVLEAVPLRSFARPIGRVEGDAEHRKQSFQRAAVPGELIVLRVRWYLRYPLSYEHVTEMMAERGVELDVSCIWR